MTISDDYAKNAYVYGYAIDECYKYLYNTTISKNIPLNDFQRMKELADYSYRDHPTINNDTIHVMGWLDVAAEPIVVSVPDVEKGRYWMLQTMDLGHYTDCMIGARTQGGKGGTYMYAGFDWKGEKPSGVDEVFRVRSNIVKIMGRIMSTGEPKDVEYVHKLQAEWKLEPLSKFLGEANSPAPKQRNYPDPEKSNWVERVNFILADGTIPEADTKWLNDFKDIGLEAGKTDFTDEQLDAMKRGEKLGMAYILEYAPQVKNANKLLGTREELQDGDRIDFAEGVHIGQWGLPPQEAVYFQARYDADGKLLDGSTGKKYQVVMDAPDVSQFWSWTVYRSSDLFMIENPLSRYSRNNVTLKPRDDGKYVIQFAYDCHGQEDNDNFLPVPADVFYVLLRLYGPDGKMIEGNYDMPKYEVVDEFAVPYTKVAEPA